MKKIRFFKKYNYNINKIVGIKNNQQYILYTDKKLIRIYRQNLKSTPLLSTYIPIENAIFYNFIIEKNVIEKIDLDSFVETKVYEEAGLLETEEYIIKYKVIDKLNDEKKVIIQCVIVPVSFIQKNYQPILEKTDYIDYISFPAFAYKSLYNGKILKKGNDLFVVILYDKIFLTFYSEGELISIITISGGLNKLYENLQSLKISNFDIDLFKKLLIKKGLNVSKYSAKEIPVLKKIEEEMQNRVKLVEEQIIGVIENYNIEDIDRIFITSEYGEIPGINVFFENYLQKKSLGFEFYKEYNLDRLPVDPFLFLAMLEAYYAYHENELKYNYSLFLRKPTFFYRPSGILISLIVLLIVVLGLYPGILYTKGLILNHKSKQIAMQLETLNSKKHLYIKDINKLKNKNNLIQKNINIYKKSIHKDQNLIKSLYKFKYSYIPKSKEILDITKLMNKYDIFVKNLSFKDNMFKIEIYSYHDKNLGKFLDALVENGFDTYFDKVEEKNGKFITNVRIKE